MAGTTTSHRARWGTSWPTRSRASSRAPAISLRQRNRVGVGVDGVLGAVYDERRDAQLPESLPPTISRVDAGMVGNARGEVGRAIEGACCDLTYARLVEGSRARKLTLAFDYRVDHGGPI